MFEVTTTRREAPIKGLFYGDGGVGKSTFCAAAPNPIFIAAEDGLVNIDAKAVKPYPRTWTEVLGALDWIATLDFSSVVVDSLDWLEPICWRHVCAIGYDKKKNLPNIEAFGYGKGYIAALDHWRIFIDKLETLRERGMHVLLIAHGLRKLFKNPQGDDYDRWSIKLHEKAAGLIKEWCDVVAFAEHEVVVAEQDNRYKGKATGKRVLRTNPSAAYDVKTRYALPRAIPLDWGVFMKAVQDGGAGAVTRLRGELDAVLAELGDEELEAKARGFLKSRGETVASLSEALETANTYLAERRKAG